MRTLSALSLVLITGTAALSGCVAGSPEWDRSFGDAARYNRAQQTIDPDAASRQREPATTDGKALAGTMNKYAQSYGYAVKETQQPALSVSTTVGR